MDNRNNIKDIYAPNGERAGYLLITDQRIEAYTFDKNYLAKFDFIRGITDRNGHHTSGNSKDLEKMVVDYYILMHPENK